jgi:alanine racemase
MSVSRRSFLGGLAAAAVARPEVGLAQASGPRRVLGTFDPWVEVDGSALLDNAATLSRLAGGRPLLAVVKNNAYGLGYAEAARILEQSPRVEGFAVVKNSAAHTLRDAGITKPVLLMAPCTTDDAVALIRRDVSLSLDSEDAVGTVSEAARRTGTRARVHLYVDTGMGRMGLPYHKAAGMAVAAGTGRDLQVDGMFCALTEDAEFDLEQVRRLTDLAESARARGAEVGRLHAASSHAVFNYAGGHLDLVRPGISLFGAYPTDAGAERDIAPLGCAVRLRARVARVERLRVGDGVSYGRRYVADRPVWTATLPVGHSDGYPRAAVNGAKILIGERLYPVIGAVSASHCIVELGDQTTVRVGDVATLLGPDAPEIQPNALAMATGTSVYDRLMHLNPGLPRVVV